MSDESGPDADRIDRRSILIPDTYADHSVEAEVRNDGVGVYDYSVEHGATTGFGLAANYLLKSDYGTVMY